MPVVVVQLFRQHGNILELESILFQAARPPITLQTAPAGIDEEGGMLCKKRLKIINGQRGVLAQERQLLIRRIISSNDNCLLWIERRDESLPPTGIAVMLELQEIMGIGNDDGQLCMAASGDEVLYKCRGGNELTVIVRPKLALLRHEHKKQ